MKALINWILERRNIALSIILSLILILARVVYTGSIFYVFLIWNLLLAGIPYLLSETLKVKSSLNLGSAALFGFTILFLPNAPYITTDLFHLRGNYGDSIWYDTLLILSFAWSGLLLFFHSLTNLGSFLGKWISPVKKQFVLIGLILLCSYGIYIGRYLRFNSWDIVSNPGELFSQLADHFVNPFSHRRTWGMTMAYGAFLILSYFSFEQPILKKTGE